MMNHTTLALVAVLAPAVVIGAVASPAFADSSKTITKEINKQKQTLSGKFVLGIQEANNCIAVLNDDNACSHQHED